MKNLNYYNDVSIPRIVFGCGLARNLDHAVSLVQADMVFIDGNKVNDVQHELEPGEHNIQVIEHKEEMMTQAKTPPNKDNPGGTEEKWEWVMVPEKTAQFDTVPRPEDEVV